MFEEILPPIADEIMSRNPGEHEEIDPAKQLLIYLFVKARKYEGTFSIF